MFLFQIYQEAFQLSQKGDWYAFLSLPVDIEITELRIFSLDLNKIQKYNYSIKLFHSIGVIDYSYNIIRHIVALLHRTKIYSHD